MRLSSLKTPAALILAPLFKVSAFEQFVAKGLFLSPKYPGVPTLQRVIRGLILGCAIRNNLLLRDITLTDGVRMTVDLTQYYGELYLSRALNEPATVSFVREHLKAGMIFIDIGANVGYLSIIAANAVGDGHVYSFEPNSELHEMFAHNVKINRFENVSLYADAISDQDGSADFYVSCEHNNSGLSSLTPWGDHLKSGALSDQRKIKVKTIKFDTWLGANPLAKIDMIKIDVEGAELHVLKGMEQTINQYKPKHIICETTMGGEVGEFLRRFDYIEQALELMKGDWGNVLYSREPM